MVEIFRKILIVLCVLAMATGNAAAFAGPNACDDMANGHNRHHGPSRDGGHADGLPCCTGVCVISTALPSAAMLEMAASPGMPVSYWPAVDRLIGRVSPPDFAPPRPSIRTEPVALCGLRVRDGCAIAMARR
ncbi:MAG: hypothetical protein WCI94_10010 [Rhodospirillales bacterium]